jgi:predicted DNA-binding transcriptional regulator YafY
MNSAHGLLVRQPLWFVIAWDTGRNAPRLFRADRIAAPAVTDHTFVPRPGELITGLCPDAKPVTTAWEGRQSRQTLASRRRLTPMHKRCRRSDRSAAAWSAVLTLPYGNP